MKFIKKAAALLLAFLMLLVPATALADETNVTDTTTAESFVCYGDDLNSEQFEKVMNLLGADLSKDQLIKVTIDDEKALLKGLKSASGYLRHQLGQAIDLRYTPELQFFMDDSIAHGAHILDLLNHVKPANPANADIVLPEDRE